MSNTDNNDYFNVNGHGMMMFKTLIMMIMTKTKNICLARSPASYNNTMSHVPLSAYKKIWSGDDVDHDHDLTCDEEDCEDDDPKTIEINHLEKTDSEVGRKLLKRSLG